MRKMELQQLIILRQKQLIEKIGLLEAWRFTKGNPDITIGVIDNGFDFFHPDLKDRLIPGFFAHGGYHTEIYENIAHGTLVSGIIVSLAPNCKVLTASLGMIEHTLLKLQKKFMKDHPKANLSEFQKEMAEHSHELKEFGEKWITYQLLSTAEAIRYLVDHNVKVINISSFFSKGLVSSSEVWNKLEEAFSYAANTGVIIVLGAGNNAQECEDYPGDENFTIVVGASTLNDRRWEEEREFAGQKIKQGSNYGRRLTLVAPVENLTVCAPHDRRFYSSKDGPIGATKIKFGGMHDILANGATSSAAPIVTSLIALLYSFRPDLSGKSVIELIKQGCDDINEMGYNIYTGYGKVNFAKTIRLIAAR